MAGHSAPAAFFRTPPLSLVSVVRASTARRGRVTSHPRQNGRLQLTRRYAPLMTAPASPPRAPCLVVPPDERTLVVRDGTTSPRVSRAWRRAPSLRPTTSPSRLSRFTCRACLTRIPPFLVPFPSAAKVRHHERERQSERFLARPSRTGSRGRRPTLHHQPPGVEEVRGARGRRCRRTCPCRRISRPGKGHGEGVLLRRCLRPRMHAERGVRGGGKAGPEGRAAGIQRFHPRVRPDERGKDALAPEQWHGHGRQTRP